jgi:hypothetical protein
MSVSGRYSEKRGMVGDLILIHQKSISTPENGEPQFSMMLPGHTILLSDDNVTHDL